MPFIKTPYNIVKFAAERTPLEVLRMFSKAPGGFAKETPEEAAHMVARAIASIPMTILIWKLALDGVIIGSPPSDPRERAAFFAEGKLPRSIKVGSKYISIERIQPLSLTLSMVADAADLLKRNKVNEEEMNKLAGQLVFMVGNNFTDNTFLKGAQDALNAWNDPVRYGENWFQSFAGTIAPAGLQQLTRVIDPNVREVNSMLDIFRARIPGWSKSLPMKVDELGRPVLRPGSFPVEAGVSGQVMRMLSPIRMKDETTDEVIKELVRIGYYPGKPQRVVGTDKATGKKIKLPPHAYEQMAIDMGEDARQAMATLMQKPGYQRLSDEDKIDKIRSIIMKARKKAKKPYFEEYANPQPNY
jgi:hypothetical protein